ncbi:MAG: glycine--tRNA ligase subunit beta, partial [Candidatus Flexifilum sp.]
PTDYFEIRQKQGIILDRAERRAAIQEQVRKLAEAIGGRVPEDHGLLDEVTDLVEAPTAFLGRFDEQYLRLPREVLVTVMRNKQRYFAVEDATGKLMAYFIGVRNGDAQHIDKVIHGNQEVLRARFSDAAYFYSQDTRRALADFRPRLGTLTFQEKLGSMLDKSERLTRLVEPLGALLSLSADDIATARRAAPLAKADLATQMVIEMTSLQGTMGREYARLSGEPEAVAAAIFEHWLPRGADDILPASNAGALLAIADRLDSLAGLFAAGLAPQSTADPYGLRRAALGIIQIVIDRQIDVDLSRALDLAAEVQPIPVTPEVRAQVLDFIAGRLRSWTDERGWRTDVVLAVLAEQAHNPYRALRGIEALSEWVARPDWEALLDGFARCVRITRPVEARYTVDPARFVEPQERALYAAYQDAVNALPENGNVDAFLNAFAPMLPAITAFFDHVLVNADDPEVRANRMGLLQAISAMQRGRADLSHLSGF